MLYNVVDLETGTAHKVFYRDIMWVKVIKNVENILTRFSTQTFSLNVLIETFFLILVLQIFL